MVLCHSPVSRSLPFYVTMISAYILGARGFPVTPPELDWIWSTPPPEAVDLFLASVSGRIWCSLLKQLKAFAL